MMGLKLYKAILHLASWLSFFILVVMILPRPFFAIHPPNPPFPRFLLILFPVLVGFFYLNSSVLIPKILARQKLALYLYILIAFAVFSFALPFLEQNVLSTDENFDFPESQSFKTIFSVILFLLILIASTGNNIVTNWFSAESQKKAIEFQKTATELSYLKSQINPHFLFNTLNNIYTLSILKSEKASDSILKLAGMMRYVLTEAADKSVPISQEIDYLQQFIDLQRIRLTDHVSVDFQVFGEVKKQEVAPLLFLPFIENAFKYGISTRIPSEIKISLTLKSDTIIFQTENQVFEEKISKEFSTGTGLKNARRRLELLYPDRHWLRTETIGNKFYADLTLTI
jgi:sensor histidine kinase YesM